MQTNELFDIAHIVRAHLKGDLTADQQQALNQWLQSSPNHQQLLDDLVNNDALAVELKLFASITEGKQEILSQLPELFNEIPPQKAFHRIHFLRTTWFKYAAAILILFSLGLAAYLWNYKSQNSLTQSGLATLKNDIPAPTETRATITLTDGRVIHLDEVSNGFLAKEGTADIRKLNDGQIIYNTVGGDNKMQYNSLSVPRGSQIASIILSDGSKVYLNSESSLTYPVSFNETERRVEITGEAYFEVAKDTKRKFIVVNGQMQTEVLGTSFNINSYGDESVNRVTLIEGSIRVSSPLTKVIIKPGQQAELARNNKIEINNNADISLVLAWQKGMFVFDNMDLSSVLRQISRWYNVDIEYKAPAQTRKFSGVLSRRSPLTEVIKILQANGVKCSLENSKLKILM